MKHITLPDGSKVSPFFYRQHARLVYTSAAFRGSKWHRRLPRKTWVRSIEQLRHTHDTKLMFVLRRTALDTPTL